MIFLYHSHHKMITIGFATDLKGSSATTAKFPSHSRPQSGWVTSQCYSTVCLSPRQLAGLQLAMIVSELWHLLPGWSLWLMNLDIDWTEERSRGDILSCFNLQILFQKQGQPSLFATPSMTASQAGHFLGNKLLAWHLANKVWGTIGFIQDHKATCWQS